MLLKLLRSALRPRSSAAGLVKRALDLRDHGRLAEAEDTLRSAVKERPYDAVAATNLALVLLEQERGPEAVGLLEHAIACDPQCAAAHFNYGNVLRVLGRLPDAISHYRAAKAADPDFPAAPEGLMTTLMEVCDWDGVSREADELRARVAEDCTTRWMQFVLPLTALFLGLDRERCKQVATHHARIPAEVTRGKTAIARASRQVLDGRVRIGYFSRDFRDHPVAHLLRTVFSLHDRQRFEVYAFSFGPDDGSAYRRHIAASVDRFIDIADQNDHAAASTIAEAGIDVLIDLMGHTTGTRLGVLARRPAPVQVHYLGYAGTTGAPYIDYLISDEAVTPPSLMHDFTEDIVTVPDCFMVSDGGEARAAPQASRAEHNLPESAYVFANFGSPARITRETFELWMHIVRAVPGSVLWLKRPHALTIANLQREAQACGIDASRIVFAERVADKSAHFGRLALADLALDTIGWHNGHSTSADMLWAGVPLLTSAGDTFASRVASSLVRAASMPELVMSDAAEYVATAVRLGNDKAQSGILRHRLRCARSSAAFFDTARLVRGLEGAYERMFAAKIADSNGSVAQSVRAGDS